MTQQDLPNSGFENSGELVRFVCAGLSPSDKTNTKDVPRILKSILLKYPRPLTDDEAEDFERIAAKVCVAKQVYSRYSQEWKRLAEPEPLSAGGWLGVTLAFLLFSDPRLLPFELNGDAQALKFLITALTALDHVETYSEIDQVAELDACLEVGLARIELK